MIYFDLCAHNYEALVLLSSLAVNVSCLREEKNRKNLFSAEQKLRRQSEELIEGVYVALLND